MGRTVNINDVVVTADDRFIRFSNPDWKEGVLRGDLYEQGYHWNGNYYDPCSGTADCPFCKKGRPQMKYAVNFMVIELGEPKPRVVELPFGVVGQLQEIVDRHGPGTLVRISRDGEGVDTRYTVKHKRDLSQQEKDEIEELPLFDLDKIFAEKIEAALRLGR